MPKESKPNESGEAEKLIARWDFLMADGAYKASIAATEEESNTCFGILGRELAQIADKLAVLIPGSFYDAMKLLGFVNSQTKDCEVRSDNLELKIIGNVTQALPDLKRDEIDKALGVTDPPSKAIKQDERLKVIWEKLSEIIPMMTQAEFEFIVDAVEGTKS